MGRLHAEFACVTFVRHALGGPFADLVIAPYALLLHKLCWDSTKPYTIKHLNVRPTLFQCILRNATNPPHTTPKLAFRCTVNKGGQIVSL